MKDLAEFSARFEEQKARQKTEGGRTPRLSDGIR
jgi:hypothetical protein